MSKLRFPLLFVLLLLFVSAFAQNSKETPEQFQREMKLAEQILADAGNLKLPENRALVFAQVGGFLCGIDEKRSRELFQISIADLIVAQQQAAEISKHPNMFEQMSYGQMPRFQILNSIAACDAELALLLLSKSRPAKLVQMIAGQADNKASSYRQGYVYSEIDTEQRLINMAADQNPERAVKLLTDSLKNGVTYQTMALLQKILQKDEKTANQLAEEAVQKLIETKLTVNDYQTSSTIHYFLAEFGRERTPNSKLLEVPESLVRNLTDRISAFWLENNGYNYNGGGDGFKLIEKYFPARAAEIIKKREQTGQEEYERYNKLVASEASVEELLKQAENFQGYRNSVYSTAARKLAQGGNLSGAAALVNSKFSDEEADQQLSDLYYNLAWQEISKGNFEQAHTLIDQIPSEQNRLNSLLQLARNVYEKDAEANKQWAVSIINKAYSLIDTSDLTQTEITNLVEVANAYSTIEPAQAFRIIESIVPALNDFTRAYTVVSQFRNEQMQRNGEFLMAMNGNFSGVYNLGNIFQNLKESDFDRTLQIINGFDRIETRLAFKLEIM